MIKDCCDVVLKHISPSYKFVHSAKSLNMSDGDSLIIIQASTGEKTYQKMCVASDSLACMCESWPWSESSLSQQIFWIKVIHLTREGSDMGSLIRAFAGHAWLFGDFIIHWRIHNILFISVTWLIDFALKLNISHFCRDVIHMVCTARKKLSFDTIIV